MIVDLSHDIFSCGTWVFVYTLVHVMCFYVYVSMVCQRCMLYDNICIRTTMPWDNLELSWSDSCIGYAFRLSFSVILASLT